VYVVRYADDLVMGFQHEEDARAMRLHWLSAWPSSTRLHPEKTRVLRFGRFARRDSPKDGRTRAETSIFWVLRTLVRKTARVAIGCAKDLQEERVAKLRAVRTEVLRRICEPVTEQHGWLCSVVRGHYQYYACPATTAR